MKITTSKSCESSKVFSIANANAPTLSAEVTNIDCNGNGNGNIDLTCIHYSRNDEISYQGNKAPHSEKRKW